MSSYLDDMNRLNLEVSNFLTAKGFKVFRRNRKASGTPKDSFATLSNLVIKRQSAELGQLVIRTHGELVVSLFSPLDKGAADIDGICEALVANFSEYRYNFTELGIVEYNDVPTTLDYFHVNVRLPYRHN